MQKIIIGLAGEIACGKGTVAKYVTEKYKGSSHRFSTVLRDVIKRIYLEVSRENMQKISTMLRDYFGSDILSKIIYHDVENDSHEIVVIDGVRRLEDIEFLKNISGFKLVYVEANIEKRYERIKQRGENTDDAGKTFEEFENDHKKEAELEIKALKDKADMVIDNNGNLEDLYIQIDKILKECEDKIQS